jgi:hypothetical protein
MFADAETSTPRTSLYRPQGQPMRARLGKARQPVATRQCPRNRERDLDYPAQSEGPDCLGSRVGSTGGHQ